MHSSYTTCVHSRHSASRWWAEPEGLAARGLQRLVRILSTLRGFLQVRVRNFSARSVPFRADARLFQTAEAEMLLCSCHCGVTLRSRLCPPCSICLNTGQPSRTLAVRLALQLQHSWILSKGQLGGDSLRVQRS